MDKLIDKLPVNYLIFLITLLVFYFILKKICGNLSYTVIKQIARYKAKIEQKHQELKDKIDRIESKVDNIENRVIENMIEIEDLKNKKKSSSKKK